MARLTTERSLEPVINAAKEWVQNCLIDDNSLFSNGPLWTLENVVEVRTAFVDHPDESKDDFSTKLKRQMALSSPSAKRLMAEMVWALLLFPSNVNVSTKEQQIGEIWSLSGEELGDSQLLLSGDVLVGIGSAGVGFNVHRWLEMVFLISLVGDLKKRSSGERQKLMSKYEDFVDWIAHVPDHDGRQFRHMLRFFCFPDRVERMSSSRERCAVLAGFKVAPENDSKKWSDRELDEALLTLRKKLEKEHPNKLLDFYEPPLWEYWKPIEDDDGRHSLLAIFVGQASKVNLLHGLKTGIWGFKDSAKPKNFEKLKPGDIIVLGSGYSGGSPRAPFDVWKNETLSQFTYALIAEAPFQSAEIEWPDEAGLPEQDRYCWRIRFNPQSVKTLANVFLGDPRLTAELSESLRKSGITNGRGYVLNASKPTLLELEGIPPPPRPDSEPLDKLATCFEDACEDVLRLAKGSTLCLASALLSKRFLILTGLAGSGKTKLAQAFARWLTPSRLAVDVFSPGSEIQSSKATYYVKRSDSLSVEFLNASNETDAIKVMLPRDMIAEWAAYIESNSIPRTTQARDIREAVKGTSRYSDQLHSFETNLKAAAFALLGGASAKGQARCYSVVPVGADWTGNENILGYPDGLQATNYVAKPALDLILHAADHVDVPHFLILDEMNLSHVERYFADILSIIESGEGLELYSGDMKKPETWRKTSAAKPVPPNLKQLPENLFIIGTVNVDETTYMFSPKVLDRANVIEFRMDAGELEGFLSNPAKPDLSKLDGKGIAFGKAFVDAAKNPVTVPTDVSTAYNAEMLLFFKALQAHGAEFGYRTAYETARFIHFYKLLGNHADGDSSWFPGAFDCVVFQKLLPKLHGSRVKLGPVLKKLWFLCVSDAAGRGADALNAAEEAARSTDKKAEPAVVVPVGAPYPVSAEKIGRMWRLLIENGFASFAEA